MVELGVQARVVQAEPVPDEPAEQHADDADAEHEARVVQRDVAVAVAEGLQQADLRALHGDEPSHHHVREERGHREEHGGQDGRERPMLRDLAHQEPVRDLVGPRVRPDAAVAREQAIHAIDHGLRVRAPEQCEADVVERPVEVIRGLQGFVAHPQHAETLVVRHQRSRPDRVDVLRRQRDAYYGQHPPAAVDDGPQLVADFEPVCLRERLRQHGLVRCARGAGSVPAAAPAGSVATRAARAPKRACRSPVPRSPRCRVLPCARLVSRPCAPRGFRAACPAGARVPVPRGQTPARSRSARSTRSRSPRATRPW